MSVYQIVTDRVAQQLQQGVVPWQKPWQAGFTVPANLVSKRAYRGLNVFLLAAQGYGSPWWATFKQIKDLGGSVRKGERGTCVVFWKFPGQQDVEVGEDPERKTRKAPLLRYYTVFNVEQADGIPAEKIPTAAAKASVQESLEAAELVLADMPQAPAVHHVAGDSAHYNPAQDSVTMPLRSQFPIAARYFSTLYHELIHATGHVSRLDRTFGKTFGDQQYAREELIAEMGAAFLAAEVGLVDATIVQSASYIATWLQRLEQDATLVVVAAGRAQRAVDFIRSRAAVSTPAVPVAGYRVAA